MRAIKPELLWIGNARDARSPQTLYDLRIECVIDLAFEEQPASLPRDFIMLRVPLVDGGGNATSLLEAAIELVTLSIRQERRTLVACSAGMSRSPAIVAAALTRTQTIAYSEALDEVRSPGPCDISPELWRDLSKLAV